MKNREELEKEAQRIITEHTTATITDMAEITLSDIPKLAAELVGNIAYEPVLAVVFCENCQIWTKADTCPKCNNKDLIPDYTF